MKKIILYIAASLDQRIAESDGSLEWLTKFANLEKTDYGYKTLLGSVDTVIMGGRTYREFLNMDIIWPYSRQLAYVVSHHSWGEKENVKFITGNIIETISELRNQEGKDILLVGGGKLISMLLAADLVDEMIVTTIPVILGNGIPLFQDNPKESKWNLQQCTDYKNGILQVIYKR